MSSFHLPVNEVTPVEETTAAWELTKPSGWRNGYEFDERKNIAWSPGSSPEPESGKRRAYRRAIIIIILTLLILICVCALIIVFIVGETGRGKGRPTDEPITIIIATEPPDRTEPQLTDVTVAVRTTARTTARPTTISTTEINACDIDNGGCSHVCTPTVDFRICSCLGVGHLLRDDNATCIYDYDEVLHKSLLFYEAQRSGKLPADNRVPWRGDSALNDVGENGEDLSGGYYDAGDHLKLGLPMAWTATILAWGLIEFPDAYESTGELDYMYDCIKWFTDYFIKCHTAENEFYAHIGLVQGDHDYWGRPEEMTMDRPAFKLNESMPGSDCVGATAAAMAAASIAFKDRDANYSALLLQEAKSLYNFAYNFEGYYSDSIPEVQSVYGSNSYKDDLIFAAAWLYLACNEQHYLDNATDLFSQVPKSRPYSFGWGDATAGYRLLLMKATGQVSPYLGLVTTKFVDNWRPGGRLPYTPQGQVFRAEWGSLRYSTSAAFIALMVAHYGHKVPEYIEWAKEQVDIALGDTGRSYVVGFGVNPPQRPHHRSSSCPDPPASCSWPEYRVDAPNNQVLTGALVGGPNINGDYYDDRSSHYMNEVTLDYNAGFQSALAALIHFRLTDML